MKPEVVVCGVPCWEPAGYINMWTLRRFLPESYLIWIQKPVPAMFYSEVYADANRRIDIEQRSSIMSERGGTVETLGFSMGGTYVIKPYSRRAKEEGRVRES